MKTCLLVTSARYRTRLGRARDSRKKVTYDIYSTREHEYTDAWRMITCLVMGEWVGGTKGAGWRTQRIESEDLRDAGDSACGKGNVERQG
jgi:hypothetical protein